MNHADASEIFLSRKHTHTHTKQKYVRRISLLRNPKQSFFISRRAKSKVSRLLFRTKEPERKQPTRLLTVTEQTI